MATVYIVSQNGRLSRKNDVLEHINPSTGTHKIFPFSTERIVFIGSSEITGSAMQILMNHHIETIFLSNNGRFNGRLTFQDGKNVFLRQMQYRLVEDGNFGLKMSKAVVFAKLKNQLTFMQRINRGWNKGLKDIKKTLTQMKDTISQINEVDNIDSLRGLEGYGARLYFSIYKYAIDCDWAVFKGRNMYPPKDNVNAVLSFIYTMIMQRVVSAIECEDMDCYVGFFHSLSYGRMSLALDLMEEFRVPVADTLTAALFNLAVLDKDDFQEKIFSNESQEYPVDDIGEDSGDINAYKEKKGVLLTREGLKKVLVQLEKKLDDGVFYKPLLKKVSYKKLIFEQVKQYKRVIAGQQQEYTGLIIK